MSAARGIVKRYLQRKYAQPLAEAEVHTDTEIEMITVGSDGHTITPICGATD